MANNPLGTRARPENEYYIGSIIQPNTGLNFRAWMPEQFGINIRSNWEPIFGYLNNGFTALGQQAAQAYGTVPNLKELSRLAWTGSEPLDLTFNFLLDAYEDSYLDVQAPIMDLARMTLPRRRGGGALLDSPGPTVLSDTNRIYLRIGKFFVLDSIVITDVDVTYHTMSDRYGQYMAADVSVAVRTHYTPDVKDVEQYFLRGRQGNNDLINASPGQTVANIVGRFTGNPAASTGQNSVSPIFEQLGIAP